MSLLGTKSNLIEIFKKNGNKIQSESEISEIFNEERGFGNFNTKKDRLMASRKKENKD